jgi:hypothetical protein
MASGVNFGTQQYFGFDPRTIPGCSLWLDAADGTTLTTSGGGNVTQWRDKSGLGATMTPIGSQSNATLQANYQNGLTAVNFSGLNMYRTPTNTGVYPSDVYILVALKSLSRMDVIAIGSTGTDNFNSLTFSEYTGLRWHNGSSGFSRTPNTVSPTNETSTSLLLMNWSLANNNFVLRRNGVQLSSTSSYTYGLSAPHAIQLGYRHTDRTNSDVALNAYIAEVVVYNRQLELGDRQEVEGYLAWKWALTSSLPNGHPYKPYPLAMRIFSPLDIPGAAIWLDAADATTLTLSGSNVTQWRDKSSQGYTLTVPSGRTSPTYSNGVLNTTGAAALWTTTNFSISGNSQVTLFLVYSTTAINMLGPGAHIGSAGAATPPTYFGVVSYQTTTFTIVYAPTCFGPDNEYIANPNISGTRIMVCGFYNGSQINGSYNGTLLGGQTLTTANFGAQPFQIGLRTANNPASADGTICEAICYNFALSTAQRQQVEGYLARKWGLQTNLPTTHPYYRVLPSTPLFTPTQVSGINAWFDGADPLATGSRPTVNTTLTTWFDKSGNGRNASGGSPATFVSGGVSFNGTSHYYTMSVPYSSNYSIFLVATNTTSPQNYFFARGSLGGGREPTFIQGYIGAGIGLEWYEGSDRATIATTPVSPFLASVDHIQGTSIVGWYYGTQAFSIPQTRAYAANAWDLLGTAVTNVGFYGGTMKELLFFSNVVTTPQRQQIEGYLAWKWGMQSTLPSTHPYSKFRP